MSRECSRLHHKPDHERRHHNDDRAANHRRDFLRLPLRGESFGAWL
jgi:hypothetical protein